MAWRCSVPVPFPVQRISAFVVGGGWCLTCCWCGLSVIQVLSVLSLFPFPFRESLLLSSVAGVGVRCWCGLSVIQVLGVLLQFFLTDPGQMVGIELSLVSLRAQRRTFADSLMTCKTKSPFNPSGLVSAAGLPSLLRTLRRSPVVCFLVQSIPKEWRLRRRSILPVARLSLNRNAVQIPYHTHAVLTPPYPVLSVRPSLSLSLKTRRSKWSLVFEIVPSRPDQTDSLIPTDRPSFSTSPRRETDTWLIWSGLNANAMPCFLYTVSKRT